MFAQRRALDTTALESTTDQTPLFTWVTDHRPSLLQVYGYDRVSSKKVSTPLDESSNLRHAMEAAAVCQNAKCVALRPLRPVSSVFFPTAVVIGFGTPRFLPRSHCPCQGSVHFVLRILAWCMRAQASHFIVISGQDFSPAELLHFLPASRDALAWWLPVCGLQSFVFHARHYSRTKEMQSLGQAYSA